MAASAIEAGKAFLELLIENKEFKKGLDGALEQLQDFGNRASKIGETLGGLGLAITAPFAVSAEVFAHTGSALNDMSERTGVAVSTLSELKYAASQTGSSIDTVEAAVRHVAKTLYEAQNGSQEASAGFSNIGLSVNSLVGLNPGEQFAKISRAIAGVKDPTERAADAMAIFGKTGTELIPMIADLDGLKKSANDLGLVMDDKAAKGADVLEKSLDTLKSQFVAVGQAVGAEVAPYVDQFAKLASGAIGRVIEWVNENHHLVLTVAAIGVTVAALAIPLAAFGKTLTAVRKGIEELRVALILLEENPYLIAVTLALTLLTAAAGPLIEKLLGLNSTNDAAAESASKHAAAQHAVADAMSKGTKAVDDRVRALENLNRTEKQWLSISEGEAKDQKDKKTADDLRVQELNSQIRSFQRIIDSRQSSLQDEVKAHDELTRDKAQGGSDQHQTNVDRALKANEEKRQALAKEIVEAEARKKEAEDARDELTGDAQKKRDEAAKKAADDAKRAQEEAAKLLQEQQDLQKKKQQDAENEAKNIVSQFDSFTRTSRGGFGGQLAAQIGGTSRQDATEQRTLRLQQELNALTTQIRDAILQGKPILIGAK